AGFIAEEIVRVPVVVANEFPQREVQVAVAGLEHEAHGAGRRGTVLRAVVRGEGAKLGDGVDGRHDVDAAGAAAVVVLATVDQPDVMVLAHAVKRYVGVGADGRRALERRHVVRSARHQQGQRVNGAAIGGELRNFLLGDHVADFAAVRLDGDGVGLNRDALLGGAQFESEVDAETVAYLEQHIPLLDSFESGSFCLDDVVADVGIGEHVLAVGLGADVTGQSGVLIGYGEGGVWNSGPGRVRYSSYNSGFLR